MSTPRFYSWDDAGSPGRNLSGNNQNRLKQILVACLVDGYGDKPGAGWTLEHEHPNGFTLSNGDKYVNFVSDLPATAPYPASSSMGVQIYVAESLANTEGAVIDGLNLCSGTYRKGQLDPSPYARHACNTGRTLSVGLLTARWTVIADDKTAIIAASSDDSGAAYHFSLYMGDMINDILGGSFVVLGGDLAPFASVGNASHTFNSGFTSPRNLSTGLVEYAELEVPSLKGRYYSVALEGDIPAHLAFRSPLVRAGDVYAGRLRGCVYDDMFAPNGWPMYLRALGFGADYSKRGIVKTIGDYQYAYADGEAGGFIMTTDPAFW